MKTKTKIKIETLLTTSIESVIRKELTGLDLLECGRGGSFRLYVKDLEKAHTSLLLIMIDSKTDEVSEIDFNFETFTIIEDDNRKKYQFKTKDTVRIFVEIDRNSQIKVN